MRLLRNILFGLVAAYGLSLIVFFAIRGLAGETTPIAQVNSILPVLLLPAWGLFPLCLLLRRARLALLVAPALLAFLLDYGVLFLPNRVAADVDAPRLTLATFNLGARTENLGPLIDVIAALDTDVVTLQELSREAEALIESALAEAYPHRALHTVESPYFGYGVLSRLSLSDDFAYPREPDRLRMQRVTLNFDSQPITLFNFHAQPVNESWRPADVRVRRDQVEFLVAEMAQVTGPRLIMGDFNLNEQSEDYDMVTANFADTFYEVGSGLGFTGPDWMGLDSVGFSRELLTLMPPYMRIDYIFHDAHFQSVCAGVWPTGGGSDHHPLVGELAFTG